MALEELRGKAAIVGIGETPHRRVWPGRSMWGLCAEAAAEAGGRVLVAGEEAATAAAGPTPGIIATSGLRNGLTAATMGR
jgi:hypothetical protein